ncbi:hypothetical protein MJ581_11390 [Escherichia coli]|nr:hypothetical protein MJ581_11390 [Escherichia coli]
MTDGNGNPLANEAVTFTLPADVSASFTRTRRFRALLSLSLLSLHYRHQRQG